MSFILTSTFVLVDQLVLKEGTQSSDFFHLLTAPLPTTPATSLLHTLLFISPISIILLLLKLLRHSFIYFQNLHISSLPFPLLTLTGTYTHTHAYYTFLFSPMPMVILIPAIHVPLYPSIPLEIKEEYTLYFISSQISHSFLTKHSITPNPFMCISCSGKK